MPDAVDGRGLQELPQDVHPAPPGNMDNLQLYFAETESVQQYNSPRGFFFMNI